MEKVFGLFSKLGALSTLSEHFGLAFQFLIEALGDEKEFVRTKATIALESLHPPKIQRAMQCLVNRYLQAETGPWSMPACRAPRWLRVVYGGMEAYALASTLLFVVHVNSNTASPSRHTWHPPPPPPFSLPSPPPFQRTKW